MKTAIKRLIEQGKQKGFVTYDEVGRSLPEGLVDPEDLGNVVQTIRAQGVRIVDSGVNATTDEPGLERLVRAGEEKGIIDDSVRYYISRIRNLPMLNREEEIRVATKIDLLRRYLVSLLFQSPIAVKMLVQRLEEIDTQDVSMRRVFETSMTFDDDTDATRSRVMAAVGRLRRKLERISAEYSAFRKQPSVARKERIESLRRECVRELSTLTIQTKVIREVIEHLDESLREWNDLRAEARRRRVIQSANRERLAQLELLAAEGPADLEYRIAESNRIFQEFESAKKVLASANVRLVISIGTQYRNRGLSLADLIQEGNLGLMKAIEKYRHRSGFKFATYAVWWIRQSISRALLEKARTIKIPVHRFGCLSRLNSATQALTQKHQRPPTVEELAHEAGVEADEAEKMLRMSRRPVSIDKPVGDDSKLLDMLENPGAESAEGASEEQEVHTQVEAMLDTLSYTEREVLRLRYGLDADRRYTLEEVGKIFGLTRERIRQIEHKAVRRLKETFQKRLARVQNSREIILERLAQQLGQRKPRLAVAD